MKRLSGSWILCALLGALTAACGGGDGGGAPPAVAGAVLADMAGVDCG